MSDKSDQITKSWTGLKRSDWRYRLWVWFARRILNFPFTVNFTPPEQNEVYAIGFATSKPAADRMRGDDLLIERLNQANLQIAALTGNRKGRRNLKRVAKAALKEK